MNFFALIFLSLLVLAAIKIHSKHVEFKISLKLGADPERIKELAAAVDDEQLKDELLAIYKEAHPGDYE